MSPTELDQFLVDYHRPVDYISVQCEWLQQTLTENLELEAAVNSLSTANTYLTAQLKEAKDALFAVQCLTRPTSPYTPSSYLNVKA